MDEKGKIKIQCTQCGTKCSRFFYIQIKDDYRVVCAGCFSKHVKKQKTKDTEDRVEASKHGEWYDA